jgi:hypothetical protein
VVAALELQPTGSRLVITPSTGLTPVSADTYDAGIIVPNGNQPGLIVPNMAVTASILYGPQGFHALPGRDIPGKCHLAY